MASGIGDYADVEVPIFNGGFTTTKSRGKSWSCLCQAAKLLALNGMNHGANAQVTAAVLITNERCLILFLRSHSFTPSHNHRRTCVVCMCVTELDYIKLNLLSI